MPIYDYKCTKCGHQFDLFRKFSNADQDTDCPECGGESSRVVSRTTFKLNGGCWFGDGYLK